MITKYNEALAEASKLLVDFQKKYAGNHDELKQVIEHALDNIKYPPAPTETLIPGAEKPVTKPKATTDKK